MSAPQTSHKPITRRELLEKELLAAMILTVILIGLSLAVPAGYTTLEPDNSALCEIRAPWLIIWLQVLLRHLSPLVAGFLIPLAVLLIVACLPWIPHSGERFHFLQYRFGFHQLIVIAIVSALACLTYLGL